MATWIKAGFWEKLCKPCQGYKGWLNLDQLIESMLPTPAYKVYTALLTQSGDEEIIPITSGVTDIGRTYIIIDNSGGADFTNIGSPNNELGTYFVSNGGTPNWGTDIAQLQYTAGAPVVTVLENTIGNIWFTYNGIGSYILNSNGLFTENKTYSNIRRCYLRFFFFRYIKNSSSKRNMEFIRCIFNICYIDWFYNRNYNYTWL